MDQEQAGDGPVTHWMTREEFLAYLLEAHWPYEDAVREVESVYGPE
jgi:hypothetical protein